MHLQGTEAAPQAFGGIDVLRGWVAGAFVGDSQLQVDPIMVGKVPSLFVHGQALSGQLTISATIGTAAPYPVDVALTGRRIEVDHFVDIAKKLGVAAPVQAWASGTVTVHTESAPSTIKPAKPEAWVEITELEAIVNHRSNDGRQTPLRFALIESQDSPFAMSLHVTPTTVELACRDAVKPGARTPCPARLDTPAGMVTIAGSATQSQMNLAATGTLDLKRLAPLFESQLEAIGGQIERTVA